MGYGPHRKRFDMRDDIPVPGRAGPESGIFVEGHSATGGGKVVLDLSRVPHLPESLTGDWPHDQQVMFSAAVSQLMLSLRTWIPGPADDVVVERLARAFAWQALHRMRRRLNDRGLLPDDEILADLRPIGTTEGRHPA